jgi:hypothetical protein
VWFQRGEGGILGVGKGLDRLVGMRQLILSMGLVSVEVCILEQRATTLSKKMSYSYHRTCVEYCCMFCKNAFCAFDIFSPLQVKNKACDGDAKHVFILEPNSLIVNITIYICIQ